MLDKKYSKLDTYRAPIKPMSVARQLVRVAPESEVDCDLVRLAEILAVDPEVIAKVRASDEDVRQHRILSSQEAFWQLRKVREEVLSTR